jgi:hypothetical protein
MVAINYDPIFGYQGVWAPPKAKSRNRKRGKGRQVDMGGDARVRPNGDGKGSSLKHEWPDI